MSMPQSNSTATSLAPLIPEAFRPFLKDRPTLWFEKADLYDKLLAGIIAQFDPKTMMDFLLVKELADLSWELQRLRGMKRAAMVLEMQDAAWSLLEKSFEQHAAELKMETGRDAFNETIRASAMNVSHYQRQFAELQDYAAVTDNMLLYKTFAMSHGTLTALDNALARAERRRDELVRMLNDRGRTAAAMSSLTPGGSRGAAPSR